MSRWLLSLTGLLFIINSFAYAGHSFYASWRNLVTTSSPSLESLSNFLERYPEPPLTNTLHIKAEKAMLTCLWTPQKIDAWFTKHPPISQHGFMVWFRTLCTLGKVEKARAVAHDFLSCENISSTYLDELKKTPDLISPKDWEARAEVIAVSASLKTLKGKKNHNEVISQLQKPYAGEVFVPSFLGRLRLFYARYLMERKRYQEALTLISHHKLTKGELYADAEWFKGWIHFYFLNNPDQATSVFSHLYEGVRASMSRSRAALWNALSIHDSQESITWYKHASIYSQTFYGLVARSLLAKKGVKLPQLIFHKKIGGKYPRSFWFNVLQTIPKQESKGYIRAFLAKVMSEYEINPKKDTNNSSKIQEALELISKNFSKSVGIWFVKSSKTQDFPAFKENYPQLDPSIQREIKRKDPRFIALVHAIIRQESRFDPSECSQANAQGLMQMLPKTAREIQKKLKANDLYNPKTNVALGSTHISKLLEKFNGSILLSVAAYNAGTKAVLEWINIFGPPPNDEIALLHWMEKIPYGETRNYVQRVIEALPFYALYFLPKEKKYTDIMTWLKCTL